MSELHREIARAMPRLEKRHYPISPTITLHLIECLLQERQGSKGDRRHWPNRANSRTPDHWRARGSTLLREILALELKCPPEEILISRDAFSRPFIDLPNAPDFNLSHSGTMLGIGVSREGRVGVDLEVMDPDFPYWEVTSIVMTLAERAVLSKLHGYRAIKTFYRLWTLKEALLKATGEGLYKSPDQIDFAGAITRPFCSWYCALPAQSPWWVWSGQYQDVMIGLATQSDPQSLLTENRG